MILLRAGFCPQSGFPGAIGQAEADGFGFHLIGPLSFTPASAPNYVPAKITIIVTCAFAAVVTIVLQFYYVSVNKHRDHLVTEGELGHTKDVEFSDETDRQNKEFRYRL